MHTHSAILAIPVPGARPALAPHARMGARTCLSILSEGGMLGFPLTEPRAGAIPARPGIMQSRGYGGIDLKKAKCLIERSFGKTLISGYFELPAGKVLISDDYLGIAIIKKLNGTDYLDKLAVSPEAQGRGIGKTIWECIKIECASLIWRASAANPANGWYARNSDGMAASGKWNVYWYGIGTGKVSGLVPLVASLPSTMI